jgi:hypothetical protein
MPRNKVVINAKEFHKCKIKTHLEPLKKPKNTTDKKAKKKIEVIKKQI